MDPDEPDCLAQIHHAVRRECARTLADALLRRTTLGFSAGQGLAAADRAAAELAAALGDDDAARAAAEAAAYRAIIGRMRDPARAAMAAFASEAIIGAGG